MTTLLVASGGGHLKQLAELAPRLRGVDRGFIVGDVAIPSERIVARGSGNHLCQGDTAARSGRRDEESSTSRSSWFRGR